MMLTGKGAWIPDLTGRQGVFPGGIAPLLNRGTGWRWRI